MLQKMLVVLAIALAIMASVAFCLVCYYIWPEKDSTLPAWIQAIGSIGAIIGAAIGIRWQIADNADRAAKAAQDASDLALVEERRKVQNLLKALSSELGTYESALTRVKKVFDRHCEAAGEQIIRVVYPDMEPRFAVYIGCTASLGLISDDALRSKIVRTYAELDAMFSIISLNSRYAAGHFEGEIEGEKADKALSDLGPYIQRKLPRAIDAAAEVQNQISQLVAPLPSTAS